MIKMRLDRLSAIVALPVGIVLAIAAALAVAALLLAMPLAHASEPGRLAAHAASAHDGYVFTTYDNPSNSRFNRLLGINDSDEMVGYDGSGAKGSPSKGYLLLPYSPSGQKPYYLGAGYPSASQNQITGVADNGDYVGFFSKQNKSDGRDDNFGFFDNFYGTGEADYPTSDPASPPVDQLLGINNKGVAVGFYVDGQGFDRGYSFDTAKGSYARVLEPGHAGASLVATGINAAGYICGYYLAGHTTAGFIKSPGGVFTTLHVPGSSSTRALGLNNRSMVVGYYATGSGRQSATHGFTWTKKSGYRTVDDPNGNGSTTVSGINNNGDLTGFYTTHDGTISDGFLAVPASPQEATLTLGHMPAAGSSASYFDDDNSGWGLDINASGFTPNSAHTVELVDTVTNAVTTLGQFTAGSSGQTGSGITTDMTPPQPPSDYKLVILAGTSGSGTASEPIAEAPVGPPVTNGGAGKPYPLTEVNVSQGGHDYGTPTGKVTLVDNPVTRTVTVTINASGLEPGEHAVQLSVGSCTNQSPGRPLYPAVNFTASSKGTIVDKTRIIPGADLPLPVTDTASYIPTASWYLNLLQGSTGDITSGGMPTISFRPLLCSAF